MEPVAAELHGRDVLARVTRFDDQTFTALRRSAGIERAEAESLSLEEILITVAGLENGPGLEAVPEG